MTSRRPGMLASRRMAGSKWLSLALVMLLTAVPSVGFATPWGTVSMRKLSPHAAIVPAPQAGFLFEVNSTGDGDNTVGGANCDDGTGKCTLRAAIQAANNVSGEDVIQFAIPTTEPNCDAGTGNCTINLTKALPDLSTNIFIQGPGADRLTVRRDTGGDYRIFNVTTTGTVTFSGLTITNGNLPVPGTERGAGIQDFSTGTVNVINCTVTQNTASDAGGIYNKSTGTVSITDSNISINHALNSGAAIFNGSGAVNILNSTISDNDANEGNGGGISNSGLGMLTINNSTISGNFAEGTGGGINNSGTLTITNSTITDNLSDEDHGGGIMNSGMLTLTNSTISGNEADDINGNGAGIFNNFNGTANVKSSIIALNTSGHGGPGPDVFGDFASQGFNLVGKTDGSTGFTASTDLTGTVASQLDPQLETDGAAKPVLKENGGPTKTIALLSGSPAIDQGTSNGLSGALTTDQRGAGFPRTADDPLTPNASGGDGTDIGAFELGLVQFSSATYNVSEGTANATITVKRLGNTDGAVTVDYATSNGTATAGQDYIATSGTLSFAANETSKTFTVPIINDTRDEADEIVNLSLSNPTGGAVLGTPATATLKIIDNDLPPRFSINDVTVTEGNSGSLNTLLTVSLSAVSGQTVTVHFATANGTATTPADYTAKSGTLTFTPGQTSKAFTVAVRGDLLDEADETFVVDLSAPVNATIADGRGVGTITDNDPPPSLSINDVTLTEGNSGVTNAVFTVKLSAASGKTVTVHFATANGTATTPSDYTATSGTLTFAAGQVTKTITVPIRGDTVHEANETFKVNLSAAVNATISDAMGVGTILNND